jgi:nucleoside-diphosphate-sugar epimerase
VPEPVVLTGATGFVGRALLTELSARGIPVHAISRRPGAGQPGVVWHQADLLTAEGRRAIARLAPRLIHAAWEVEHGAFWTSPGNALWQAASLDLVQRFRSAGGGQVVCIGTCAEYGATGPGPWNESRPIAPTTSYGQAKAALCRDLQDLCGERLIWARLFHLYGPGEDPRRLIPMLIRNLRSGQPAEVRASGLIRDYASTPHVAACLAALLQTGAAGIFDIGSGQPRSLGALAGIVAETLGKPKLLQLSHRPTGEDLPVMAPDLFRLHERIGRMAERPELALAAYSRSWHESDRLSGPSGDDPSGARIREGDGR